MRVSIQVDVLVVKIKNVRPPPFVPLDRQEEALLKDLEFRRATGADVLPVQFQLIALYLIWSAGDDPRDSFSKGEAMLQQVLERHRRGPPVDNAIATAARWHFDRGQLEQALPFFQELLTEQRARLGVDHPTVATTLCNIGTVRRVRAAYWLAPPPPSCELRGVGSCRAAGDGQACRGSGGPIRGAPRPEGCARSRPPRCGRDPVQHWRRLQGASTRCFTSERIAASFSYRQPDSFGVQAMGDLGKALECLEEDLRISRGALGPDHHAVATSLTSVSQVHIAMGHFDRARALLEQAAEIDRRQLGEQHPDYATDLNELGRVCQKEGSLADALDFFERAAAIYRASYGQDHQAVAAVLNNMGSVCWAQGRNKEALEHYDECLRIQRAALGDRHPDTALTVMNIGTVLQNTGDLSGALQRFEEALAVQRAALGPDHHAVGATLTNMAQACIAMGQLGRARALLEQAAEIDRRQLGEQHPDYATDLNELGRVCQKEGSLADALDFFERAAAIYRASYGQDHQAVATPLWNMGLLLEQLGNRARARTTLAEAHSIFALRLGVDHPDTREVAALVATLV